MIPSNDNETGNKGSNTIKDPDDWRLDDRRRKDDRCAAFLLTTLSTEAGEEFDENLTKAEASKRIEELQHKTGRGVDE